MSPARDERLERLAHRHLIVRVHVENGPDDHARFRCLVNGGIEYWTFDRILEAIGDGDDVGRWDE